jgi:hypothetical protein
MHAWVCISNNLPQNLWVSRVIASKFKKERVYATLNGYRFDDFTAYVYVSDDYGQTWKNIGNSLPAAAVNVIREDSENENMLYVGTDNGLYVSLNGGGSWEAFSNNLPNVAVHDLVIQPTAKHLIVGTHGRSLYKANVAALQKMNAAVLEKAIHVFAIENVRKSKNWGRSWSQWRIANTPEVKIPFYSNSSKKITIAIYSGDIKVNSISVAADKGFNELSFDVSFSKKGKKAFEKLSKNGELKEAKNGVFYLLKGVYTVKIGNSKNTFEIK